MFSWLSGFQLIENWDLSLTKTNKGNKVSNPLSEKVWIVLSRTDITGISVTCRIILIIPPSLQIFSNDLFFHAWLKGRKFWIWLSRASKKSSNRLMIKCLTISYSCSVLTAIQYRQHNEHDNHWSNKNQSPQDNITNWYSCIYRSDYAIPHLQHGTCMPIRRIHTYYRLLYITLI